jgi:hypothetical protein
MNPEKKSSNEISKKNQVDNIVEQDEESFIYQGEIIDEDQESAAIEKKVDPPPSRQFAFTLGKIAGSAITLLGVIGEVRRWLNIGSKNSTEKCKGRGMRRRRYRRR